MKRYQAKPGRVWRKVGEDDVLGSNLYLPDGIDIETFEEVDSPELEDGASALTGKLQDE